MAKVMREFVICDRCMKEVQVYEVDDEGTMTDAEWAELTINSRSKNLCPECTEALGEFLGMV